MYAQRLFIIHERFQGLRKYYETTPRAVSSLCLFVSIGCGDDDIHKGVIRKKNRRVYGSCFREKKKKRD